MNNASRGQGATLPNLFIVGVPKAGTTSLHHSLAEHPDVFMTQYKEQYQFCPDLRLPPMSEQDYREQFRPGMGRRWLGESTPLYMASDESAARIARFNPSARIIMMLREPIQMMQALYGQQLSDCVPCKRDFESELRSQEADWRRGKCKVVPGFVRMSRFLEIADYVPQIRRFLDQFPASQIRVILFDDFIQDPEGVYADVLRWLELPVVIPDAFPKLGRNRVHVDPTVIRAVRTMTPITRHLRRLFPKTVDSIAGFIRDVGTRSVPPLDPAVQARLQAEFFPDFRELESLIGQSLERWRLNASPSTQSGSGDLTGTSAGRGALVDALRTQALSCRVPGRTPRPSVLQPTN